MNANYEKAYKIGKKEGGHPPVLDNILKELQIALPKEVELGVTDIPLELVIGTKTSMRSDSFGRNFFPVLAGLSEFSSKWTALCDIQLHEGIRDPIKVYEFMNKYYVDEGNKRVSVLKFLGAVSVRADVTRIIPPWTNTRECILYYEFMKFYDLSGVNYIYFSKPGSFVKLQHLTGKMPDEKWSAEDRETLRSLYYHFKTEYDSLDVDHSNLLPGDVLLFLINLYDYKTLCSMSTHELKKTLIKSSDEFRLLKEDNFTTLKTDPAESSTKFPLIKRLIPLNSPLQKVAFIYAGNTDNSGWTMSHEEGRKYLDKTFADQIRTKRYENTDSENIEDIIQTAIDDGNDIIFTASSLFFKASLKAAIANPKIKILNCSLNVSHRHMRTYYARIYESKFLIGAIAGALAENDKIGYIADCPLYGTAANINAFALGAKIVNPRAKVYLAWECLKNADNEEFFNSNEVSYISGPDIRRQGITDEYCGLYQNSNDHPWRIAVPIMKWGHFYERIIRMIMQGSFKYDGAEDTSKALNYWWGMSAGVADVICSSYLPVGTARLIGMLKNTITSGEFNPFFGPLYSQDGIIQKDFGKPMSPNEIITMNWLAENVIGSFPDYEDVSDDAKKRIKLQEMNYLE